MKNILLLFIISANYAFAQSVDYSRIILPEATDSISFEERLVQLAWQNHPSNEIVQREVTIAQKNVNLARFSWTNNLRVFYNLNDRTMTQEAGGWNQPRYGLGLSVNVGDFILIPTKTRIAREEANIALAAVNEQKITIRAEVIRRYHKYLLSQEILQLRLQSTEDAYSSQVLMNEKFRKGEISLEEYNQALQAYSKAMEIRFDSEHNMLINKASVEEMIGMKLEEVK